MHDRDRKVDVFYQPGRIDTAHGERLLQSVAIRDGYTAETVDAPHRDVGSWTLVPHSRS